MGELLIDTPISVRDPWDSKDFAVGSGIDDSPEYQRSWRRQKARISKRTG